MREIVRAFFQSEEIAVEDAEDGKVLRVAFEGENGRFLGLVRVHEGTSVLAFYTLCPIEVPPEKMADAAELVARLNNGHVLGNLELDVDDGTMRFKTSVDVEGAELTEDLVANVVYANVASLDQMLPAITAVVVKGTRPRDAALAIAGP